MRFLLSTIIWIFFLGGVSFFLQEKNQDNDNHQEKALAQDAQDAQEAQEAQKELIINLQATFEFEKDSFALEVANTDTDNTLPLTLILNGVPITTEQLAIGKSELEGNLESSKLNASIKIVAQLKSKNELFIKTVIPANAQQNHQALRVSIYNNQQLILDRSLWGRPGQTLSESFVFEGIK
ncbi:MAG: hypothetical protein HQK50_00815 [Oligoflexia bacterium]|nr:hypothetical protein [Oligoflexia bacterium]MBF0364077.1 hypothetical protein [Oligoflexia bacterium]